MAEYKLALALVRASLDDVVLALSAAQFSFTNAPNTAFTVLATTNPAVTPANWTVLGSPTEISPGQYEFTDLQATNTPGPQPERRP
jgi:hypothetical protein